MKKVDIIIGGGQKCGTTALHNFFSYHPKLITSNPKEIDFFNFDKAYSKGISFYHTHFKKPFLSSLRGFKFVESSPSYIISGSPKKTAQRMYAYNPDLKLIFLVRDPVDRAFSAFQMYKKRVIREGHASWFSKRMKKKTGNHQQSIQLRDLSDYDSFEQYVRTELQCRQNNQQIEAPVLSLGFYANGIKSFMDYFGDNVRVIQNEQMRTQTAAILTQLNNFIEIDQIDWSFTKEKEIFAGNYSEEIDLKTKTLLQQFYVDHNKKLFDLTGINYNQNYTQHD